MNCIWYDLIIGLITGFVSGALSGWLISRHFKKVEKKKQLADKKHELFLEWHSYLWNLRDRCFFEFNEEINHGHIITLLNRSIELLARSVPYGKQELLGAVQLKLYQIENELSENSVDAEKVDILFKDAIKEMTEAFI